jgi:glycolate oxidase FAD binding subunit
MDELVRNADESALLVEQINDAIQNKRSLRIKGGDSKAFLGHLSDADILDTRSHCGIVSYDPTELVVTARAGTTVAELNAALDASGQMLPSEAPGFDGAATVGGMVASGLSGPRRPWSGSVRDFVLGCRVITGRGKHLRFGGEVMKNVAGYDVSRLFAGSFGGIGLITEVSLKVLPKPRATLSLFQEMSVASAMSKLIDWRRSGVPIAGACHVQDTLYVRLEGGEGSVKAAREIVGGLETNFDFWHALREFSLPFFAERCPLWRISLPSGTPNINLPGTTVLDWGGAQRWLKTDASPETIREIAHRHGGYATCFTPSVTNKPFQPLPASLLTIHKQLKTQLDPHGIFNPGRMYADL